MFLRLFLKNVPLLDQVCGEEQRRAAHVSGVSGQRVQGPLCTRTLRKLQQQQRREAEGGKTQLHQRRQQVQGERLKSNSGLRLKF